MKFWQLLSIMRDKASAVGETAGTRDCWREYQDGAANADSLIGDQRRDILDATVPSDFAEAVLATSDRRLYLGRDGWLRSRRRSGLDRELTLVQAAVAHGGSAVEDALEYGSVKVGRAGSMRRAIAILVLLAATLALGWAAAVYTGLL